MLLLLLAAGLAVAGAGCRGRESGRVIKLAHGLDVTHSVHRGMVRLGELLAAKSSGRLRVEVYANGQLGSERECLELVQLGGLGMTKVSSSVLEGFAPEFKVFGLPYLFRDAAHRQAVFDGPLGREILAAPERKFLRGVCYYDAGSRSFYTKKPVRTPADLRGLKIRVQESPMAFALIRAFGASATPIAFGELYTALQQGVVDGAENNPPSFHLARHYEVCRFYTLNEHTSVPDVLVVGTDLWNRLTAEERRWLQEAAEESAVYQRGLWAESEAASLAAVQAAGVEVIRPDRAAFYTAAAALRESVRDDPVIEEVARYLMIWVGLLGAAYATGRKAHLALDLLTGRLQGGARRVSECFIHSVVLAFAALVMVGGGGRLVWVQLSLGQKSAALQLNVGLVYLAVPLAGAAIVLYSVGALLDLRRGADATAGQASSGLN